MAKVNLKHSGAVIDQQIDRVLDGSVVVENTLSALDETSDNPVSGKGIAEAIEAASNNLKERGYIYMGVATPTTTPDVSGGKVFYLAAQAGEYTNFGITIATDALTSLEWNGQRWFAIPIVDLVTPAEVEEAVTRATEVGDVVLRNLVGEKTNKEFTSFVADGSVIGISSMSATPGIFNQMISPIEQMTVYSLSNATYEITGEEIIITPTQKFIESGTQAWEIGTRANTVRTISGHKYLMVFDYCSNKDAEAFTLWAEIDGTLKAANRYKIKANEWGLNYTFFEGQGLEKPIYIWPSNALVTDKNLGDYYKLRRIMLIDLTKRFGVGNEPTTYNEFCNEMPELYYPTHKDSVAMNSRSINVAYEGQTKAYPIPMSNFPYGLVSSNGVSDTISGTVVKRCFGSVDLSSLSLNYNGYFETRLHNVIGAKYNGEVVCSRYVVGGTSPYRMSYRDGWLYITDPDYTSVEEFKEGMAGVRLYYELPTPEVTYTLSPFNVSFFAPDKSVVSLDPDSSPVVASVISIEKPRANDIKGSTLRLPIPRVCAKVNITSSTGLATTKTDNKRCELEYWDKDGNYFKKWIVLNAQGSSSMSYTEKNQSIDLFNDAECTDSFKVQFGDWVEQDSFHLKCYYIDVFRGISNVCYNLVEQGIKQIGCRNSRLAYPNTATTAFGGIGVFKSDFGTGAKCHPDGFPFELYVNGEYYGLFAWNLKKHRDNYAMEKSNASHILLDGVIDSQTIFGGVVDWSQFEIRNPKDLVTTSGEEYDGESPSEIIGVNDTNYDANNEAHLLSAEVKSAIERLSSAKAEIDAIEDIDEARSVFEQYFDPLALNFYFVMAFVTYHYDGFRKNWIWTIYNGIASPSFYDMDSVFGRHWNGTTVVTSSTTSVFDYIDPIWTTTKRLYFSDMCLMYAALRNSGIVSVENIMREIYKWMERVGIEAYKRNIEQWPNIPSYREAKTQDDGTAEGGMFDSPERIHKWLELRIALLDTYYGYAS